MIRNVIISFFCCLFVNAALGSDVLEFTNSNFDTNIKQHEIILVEFYAPWCGHCKRLAPEYEEAATRLKSNDPPISLAKVDCTAESDVCSKFGVSGYPTLKIFKNGEFSAEYQGPREADGIVKYMKSKAGPSSRTLKDSSSLDKLLGGSEPFIAGFFSNEDSKLYQAYKQAADALNEDFSFAHSLSDELNKKLGFSDQVVIMRPKMLQNKFEDKVEKYTGADSIDDLRSWIEDKVYGLAGQRTTSNSKYFKQPLINAFYNVDYERDPKGTNYWRNRLMKVAQKFQKAGQKLKFAISNSKAHSYELGEFGVDSPDEKKVYITAKNEKGQKFKMDQDFSMESFEKFLKDLTDGKLSPYLKSEAVPESQNEPVKVAVGKNFDEIVNDPNKDVLIEFYAPWCGHCKTLAPKYDELAQKLADEPSITIAKMDATANDVPSPYDVRGFPTLYFAPKGDKSNPKQYQGGREVKDFIKYLAAEASDELRGYDRSGKAKKKEL